MKKITNDTRSNLLKINDFLKNESHKKENQMVNLLLKDKNDKQKLIDLLFLLKNKNKEDYKEKLNNGIKFGKLLSLLNNKNEEDYSEILNEKKQLIDTFKKTKITKINSILNKNDSIVNKLEGRVRDKKSYMYEQEELTTKLKILHNSSEYLKINTVDVISIDDLEHEFIKTECSVILNQLDNIIKSNDVEIEENMGKDDDLIKTLHRRQVIWKTMPVKVKSFIKAKEVLYKEKEIFIRVIEDFIKSIEVIEDFEDRDTLEVLMIEREKSEEKRKEKEEEYKKIEKKYKEISEEYKKMEKQYLKVKQYKSAEERREARRIKRYNRRNRTVPTIYCRSAVTLDQYSRDRVVI